MEIQCKCCRQWFIPSEESIEMISGGFINVDSVNMCDDCWNLQQLSEYDYTESLSYSDPVL
jgi:hypothetical protein